MALIRIGIPGMKWGMPGGDLTCAAGPASSQEAAAERQAPTNIIQMEQSALHRTSSQRTAIFGFNTLHLAQGINPILGPNWSDMMTYCDYQWMSKITYVKLKEAFQSYLPLTAVKNGYSPAASTTTYPVLAIFGMLDAQTLETEMLPVSVIQSETEVARHPQVPLPSSSAIQKTMSWHAILSSRKDMLKTLCPRKARTRGMVLRQGRLTSLS